MSGYPLGMFILLVSLFCAPVIADDAPVHQPTAPVLEPLGLGGSLAYGGFSVATEAAIYWPSYYGLDKAGLPPHYNQLSSLTLGYGPMMGLLVADMKREGVTWREFGQRMRFHKPKATDWGWALLATGVGFAANMGLSKLNDRITYPIPSFYDQALGPYPEGDVQENLLRIYGSDRVKGNWAPAIALSLGNAFSVTAEELYWRGLVLPRMELGLGSWAWVVQGLLWAPAHGFKYWDILPLLGVTLPLAALGQKTKNTTVVWVTHMAINVGTGVAGMYLVAATGIPEDQSAGDLDTARLEGWGPLAPAPLTVNFLNVQGRW